MIKKLISISQKEFSYLIILSILLVASKYAGLLFIPVFIVAFLKGRIRALNSIKLLWIIFFIAIISGKLNFLSDPYIYFKDFLFFLQVPLILSVLVINRSSPFTQFKYLKILIIFIFIVSLSDLGFILVNFDEYLSIGNFRFQLLYKANSSYSILGIGLLLPFLKYKPSISMNIRYKSVFLTVLIVHILLSASRTTLLLLPLIYVSPYLVRLKRAKLIVIAIAIIPVIGGSIQIFIDTFDLSSNSGLITKLLRSFDEIAIGDQANQELVSKNWRGYEAFLGVSQYLNGNIFNYIFGSGLGSYVIVPEDAFSGEVEGLQNISFFHNGYITVLLKSGILGLFIFGNFLFSIINKVYDHADNLIKVLTVNIVFIVVFVTLTSHGLYKPSVSIPLVLALGVCLKLINNKNYLTS